MLNNRLLCRTARSSSRGGFTLVELLVVIGIIAILAGVALGPITNGIKQAKHNTAMQQGRQLGQICFSYSTDNTQNGNAYPAAATAHALAINLLNANYASDPTLFAISGAPGITPFVGASSANMAATNVSWSFTVSALTTTGGVTSSTGDLIPLIFFNGGTGTPPTPFPQTAGTAANLQLVATCPFLLDGVAVFYKGNNALYIKATGATPGLVTNFISQNNQDGATYTITPP